MSFIVSNKCILKLKEQCHAKKNLKLDYIYNYIDKSDNHNAANFILKKKIFVLFGALKAKSVRYLTEKMQPIKKKNYYLKNPEKNILKYEF